MSSQASKAATKPCKSLPRGVNDHSRTPPGRTGRTPPGARRGPEPSLCPSCLDPSHALSRTLSVALSSARRPVVPRSRPQTSRALSLHPRTVLGVGPSLFPSRRGILECPSLPCPVSAHPHGDAARSAFTSIYSTNRNIPIHPVRCALTTQALSTLAVHSPGSAL